METTLAELTGLRLRILSQHPSFKSHPMVRELVSQDLRRTFSAATKSGIVETFRDPKSGRLRAALILAKVPPFYSKRPAPIASLFLPGGDPAGERWMRARLHKHRNYFSQGLTLRLEVQNTSLLEDLGKLGVHISSAVLAGDPKRALEALRRKYGQLTWADRPELKVEMLRTAKQVDAIIRLMRREFTRNPQFGWFVASRDFLAMERRMLNRERKRTRVSQYVILGKHGELLGHFGFDVAEKSPFGKRAAGMALNFDPRIQGRGLGKYAYTHMLKRMIELRVGIFIGGTSQRPVLELSRTMERPLIFYAMRYGKPFFPRKYFNYP